MWHALRRAGWQIGRDQCARLMRIAAGPWDRAGLQADHHGSGARTGPPFGSGPARLQGPGGRTGCGLRTLPTCVPAAGSSTPCSSSMSTAVGSSAGPIRASRTTHAQSLEALEHALAIAKRGAGADLVHHSDRGSQYVAIACTERLAEAGIQPSVGAVGDSYGNALAETVNGLYKTELIYRQPVWRSLFEVEFATMNWVR